MGMLMKWFQTAPQHIKKLEVIFLVIGHSYLPPDRVFGNIEKVVRKRNTLVTPDEYYEIFGMFESVSNTSSPNFPVFDWRKSAGEFPKKPGNWHFGFNSSKRFILTREAISNKVSLRGEQHYRSDVGVDKSTLKQGKKLVIMNSTVIPAGNVARVKKEKLNDVRQLLETHFGNTWNDVPELRFYKDIFDLANDDEPQQNEETADLCVAIPDEITLSI